jgi:hypothetical protein
MWHKLATLFCRQLNKGEFSPPIQFGFRVWTIGQYFRQNIAPENP